MNCRKEKARQGGWNGGFAPYGYSLVNGELVINEDEAETVRKIFDLYVNTNKGRAGIAKELNLQGIAKLIKLLIDKITFTLDGKIDKIYLKFVINKDR